ncbi:alpha/beta hydrolase [Phanerochaete sordida]|uniref:Alpha/beta hydrolase n=1 Tax=Phanerochaete sordida TaxID=48140 RepID=A0A9P3LJE4_9APHY|nr:alpha/beta hydrolase [Phanerochaete sordida]
MAGRVPDAPPLYLFVIYQTLAYLVFALAIIPVLLYRLVFHILPSTRPYPTWSLRRDLAVAGGRLYMVCTTYPCLPRPPGHKAWQSDPIVQKTAGPHTKVKLVEVPPAEEEWMTGIANVAKGVVCPVPVPCFWTFCPREGLLKGDEDAPPDERVIFYVAGGSWVMGHPQSTMFPYKFATESGRRVFAVNHRKALSADTAFPAQLQDLVAAYAHLRTHGFAPENIVLIGDSSGGHLLLALSRYLAELAAERPELDVGTPGALLLISPSCDLGHPPHAVSSTDFLAPYLNNRAYPSLARHFAAGARQESAYFSPAACGSFAYLAKAQERARPPAVWIQYGEVENLAPDIAALVQRMRADGVVVDVDLIAGGVHCDAGIAYALREKGERDSWGRLIAAVKRYTA